MDKKIINTQAVAKLLGVSINTVRIWRTKDRGPKYHVRGYNRYFYYEHDVLAFAQERGFVNESA
jgi:DNA-binding transcriptional MerR regulator